MKGLFVNILSLISLFLVASLPVKNSSTLFDRLSREVNTTCPQLKSHPLVNRTAQYFTYCQSLPDADLSEANKDSYLCLGVLDAGFQLCKVLSSKKSYESLPKKDDEIKIEIDKISTKPPDIVCKEFSKFHRTEENTTLEYMRQLDGFLLKEKSCKKICIGLRQETNELCSLMHFIYTKIDDIKTDIPVKISHALANNNEQSQTAVDSNKENKPISPTDLANKAATQNNTSSLLTGSDTSPQEPAVPSTSVNKPPADRNPASAERNEDEHVLDNNLKGLSNQVVSVHQPMPITMKPVDPIILSSVQDSDLSKNPISKTTNNNDTTTKLQPVTVAINLETNADKKNTDKQNIDTKNVELGNVKENTNEKLFATESKTAEAKTEDIADESGTPPEDEEQYPDDTEADLETKPSGLNPAPQKEVISIANPAKNDVDFDEVEDSNFFSYFMFISVLFICGYIAYHNKQKILALVLEGRRERGARRRPNTASYRKLNSNLEEAVTSKSGGSASHVIY